jgi:hypothetical protein
MAMQKLDNDTSINLTEGEFVIFSNIPKIRVYHKTGFFSSNKVNFVVTNKRIALVPYKAGKEEVSLKFEDISSTFPVFSTIERKPNWGDNASTAGNKVDLQIIMNPSTGKKKQKFEIHASAGTILKNLAKDQWQDTKKMLANMGQIMDNQARANDIDRNVTMSSAQKEAAKNAAWWETTKEWKKYTDSGAKGSGLKGEHFVARNIIVELVDAGISAYNG